MLSLAATMGVRPLVIPARDGPAKKNLEMPASSTTSYLPGYLVFVPGARCTLKINLATERGLYNTAPGTMASLVLAENEPRLVMIRLWDLIS